MGAIENSTYNPHPPGIDYREPYRPQFHFSPKSDWMNDINALIYQDGLYHMLYQWGLKCRHGGYATSRDLIHWEDRGVALTPQDSFLPAQAVRNVAAAEVYSGSGVLVSGAVAERITGSPAPAMVAIYTGTKLGTCLAWTQDQGRTWHDYPGNPVANPTEGDAPRDPCVFWYAPEAKWVMALYEEGTSFYASHDLIEWTFLSRMDFGFECPDVYQLAVDGDPSQMKWVLQDAAGKYLVGDFDGCTFHPEQAERLMDQGPDFYAAQSFHRESLPEDRVIQIGWNDAWNGGVGEQGWQRNATFPVELGLVSRGGACLVTRRPIEAIQQLHGACHTWTEVTLQPTPHHEANLFAGIRSKCFDLTACFDLGDCDADWIIFRIAGREIRYSPVRQMFVGRKKKKGPWNDRIAQEVEIPLALTEAGELEIRLLIDWSNIEIFAQGGTFSYSEYYGFAPDDDKVGLSVLGGAVRLRELRLYEMKSIWQPQSGDGGG